MKISYCITACNEHAELEKLLRFLKQNIREEDEVIIQLDVTYTSEVLEVCNLFTNFNHEGDITSSEIKNSKFYAYPLDKDFARFKNYLATQATGDYIFSIDADEIPNKHLIEILPNIIEQNDTVELLIVPRINTVSGLTPEHVQKWKWRINENGWINFPDYQTRIYKNDNKIQWRGKVHERIVGFNEYAYLPDKEEWCLYHPKEIKRQEKQNDFYSTI